MLKTISAALLAVSVLVAPTMAASTAKTTPAHVTKSATVTAQVKKDPLNANAKMGKPHVRHLRHHRIHRHYRIHKLYRHHRIHEHVAANGHRTYKHVAVKGHRFPQHVAVTAHRIHKHVAVKFHRSLKVSAKLVKHPARRG